MLKKLNSVNGTVFFENDNILDFEMVLKGEYKGGTYLATSEYCILVSRLSSDDDYELTKFIHDDRCELTVGATKVEKLYNWDNISDKVQEFSNQFQTSEYAVAYKAALILTRRIFGYTKDIDMFVSTTLASKLIAAGWTVSSAPLGNTIRLQSDVFDCFVEPTGEDVLSSAETVPDSGIKVVNYETTKRLYRERGREKDFDLLNLLESSSR